MSKLCNFINFLSVSVFVQRAYRELDRISDEDYFLRKGKDTKKFVDEILPLTVFLKYFERPGRKIRCRYFPDSQNYDAIIKVYGSEVRQRLLEESYYVEVTVAEEEHTEHLRRESLARYGFVFGGDNIHRIKNNKSGIDFIQSRPVVQDLDYPVKKAIELVKKAIEKKSRKPYPTPCILIIELQPERALSLSEWLTLITDVRNSMNSEKFRETYVVNWSTSQVHKI